MAWRVVAVVGAGMWAAWAVPATGPCGGEDVVVARQGLGPAAGAATVDVSADGRFVAFTSLARLTPADDDATDDVYVLDRATGAITLESVGADGRAAGGSNQHPRVSGDGRVVVFSTISNELSGSRGDALDQVVRRDRTTGAVTLVSHTPAGTPGDGWSGVPDVSDDGRFVVFESRATDLVPGPDANGVGSDIEVFDAADGVVRRVSLTSAGEQPATGQSGTPAISGNGRVVVFSSTAVLDPPALGNERLGPPRRAVFARDLSRGTTVRVSVSRDRQGPDGDSYYPAVSADGRRIAFVSTATNLDDDRRAVRQENVYLFQAEARRLKLLSRGAAGGPADGPSRHPAVSGDGRYVLFSSDASNLHCRNRCGAGLDLNLVTDVYREDVATGVVERVSGGLRAGEAWWNASSGAATDATGRVVAFSSRQPIDDADLDHDDDLYVAVQPGLAGCSGALSSRPASDRFVARPAGGGAPERSSP